MTHQGDTGETQEVSQLVKTSWEGMVKDFGDMPNSPAEDHLEFGIDVGAEGACLY